MSREAPTEMHISGTTLEPGGRAIDGLLRELARAGVGEDETFVASVFERVAAEPSDVAQPGAGRGASEPVAPRWQPSTGSEAHRTGRFG